MLTENRGNSVSGDLKRKTFLGGCPQTRLERISSGYLQPCVCSCKLLYHMWAFSLFSKSHIGHVNHGKSENICGVGVSSTFLAVMRCSYQFFALLRYSEAPNALLLGEERQCEIKFLV